MSVGVGFHKILLVYLMTFLMALSKLTCVCVGDAQDGHAMFLRNRDVAAIACLFVCLCVFVVLAASPWAR